MSLYQAISSALSGLRVTQSNLALVSTNIANADTPGYTRKRLAQVPVLAGGVESGVRVAGVNRALDVFVQRQLNLELAGGAYADTRVGFLSRLDELFGRPGSPNAIDTTYNGFLASLQKLSAAPESPSLRAEAVNAALSLTQHLNSASQDIQSLRTQAEQGLSESVERINSLLSGLERVNGQIMASGTDSASAGLLDDRDRYLAELSEYLDIRTMAGAGGGISVFTTSGVTLLGGKAARLSFDAHSVLRPGDLWSADPTRRGVGTITLAGPNGTTIDLLANKSIRSGRLAALVEMRDKVLVEAQAGLDAIAAAMADAVSARTIDGVPAPAPPAAATSFSIPTDDLKTGNVIRLTWTDSSNVVHKVSIVRMADGTPLPANATPEPDDLEVAVDWSKGFSGAGNIVDQLNAALGGSVTVSNSGTTLVFADVAGVSDVTALSARATVTSLTGQPELPLFMDGGQPFTGAFGAAGPQERGFAGRIGVNAALLTDPSRLVAFQSATPASDPTRIALVRDRLDATGRLFGAAAGIGSTATPYSGTIGEYLGELTARQGLQAETGKRLAEGQEIVVNALRERHAEVSGVDIDQEMAHLLQLQTAYAASARVLSAAKEMFETLSRM